MSNPSYRKWSNAYETRNLDPYQQFQRSEIYPFQYNWWREFPLDGRPLIRNNVAGHYPPVKLDRTVTVTPDPPFEYAWQFVCSTIFPKNPQFAKDNQIIPQP